MIGQINIGNKNNRNINKILGVRRSLTATTSEWERIEDSIGLIANAQKGNTPVRNDFDSIYPWSDIISYNYDVKGQRITAYYGDPTFKFDGSNGDVFTKIPEFYYKRTRDSQYEYIYICRNKLDGYIKSEQFSIARYTMSGSSSRVYSRSGYAPLTNVNITNFRTYARNLGVGFGQLDWHYFIIQMLYLVEYADYNSQKKLGPGYTNSSHTGPINSGGCNFLGMKSGSVDGTDNTSMIYRGIEDIYGNIWQFVDGININNYKTYICYDSDKYAVDTFSGSYKPLSFTNSSVTNSYVKKLGFDPNHPLVSMATEVGGSSDTYISDNYWCAGEKRIALVGGDWYLSSLCGLWCWNLYDTSSVAWTTFGARLLRNQ